MTVAADTVYTGVSNTHNLDINIKDKVIYESNYTSGLRLFDADDVPTTDLERRRWRRT